MIEQCEKCKHKKILNGGIVGCLYMDADCRKGEMFDPITNADRMIKMLQKNDAYGLLDWWQLILEDGVPSEDYFKWWLKQPAEE